MSRINTNINSIIGARILNDNQANLQTTLERLSTGYKINSGKDDPAGLIASEQLRGEMAGLKSAINNADRANGVISTAESALSEISDKLVEMQELVSAAVSEGGLSDDEINANQTQIDGIIDAINRVSSETSFMGKKLLNGTMGFQTSSDATNFTDLVVNKAKGFNGSDQTLTVSCQTSAAKASNGVASIVALQNGASSVTYRITGSKGTATVSFGNGATVANVQDAVDALSEVTGIAFSGTAMVSTEFGSDQFISVEIVAGDASAGLVTGSGTDGSDAEIAVNGVKADVDNYNVSFKTSTLDVSFRMTDAFVGDDGDDDFKIVEGGGASFMLSPDAGLSGKEVIGIQSVSAYDLGQADTGFISSIATGQDYSLKNDASTAQDIVGKAINQVAKLRGRLGSFLTDTVESAVNTMNTAYENIAAAESAIRDTDFATETAELTRNQILVSASNSVLSIATQAPQSVLQLL